MEKDIDSLYQYTFELLIKKKKEINDVIELLVKEKGLTENEAFDIIQDIFSFIKEKEKKDAQKNIRIGTIIFLFGVMMGLALVIFSPESVTYGYLGLMIMSFILGGVQLFRGLIRFVEDKSLNMDNYVINDINREGYNHSERSTINNFENNTLQSDKEVWEDVARCQNNIIHPPHGSNEYYCPQCENEAIWIHYKDLDSVNDCHMVICPACKLVLHSQPIKYK